jgi:catechol 2,3-dioxygenase-like lactoylglutathione lyase family enzyme
LRLRREFPRLIDHLDHFVLTTTDEAACIAFYVDLLGMRLETFGQGRRAFRFGNQKINLHVKGHEFEPRAHLPVPGALDFCFIASKPLDEVIAELKGKGATIILGPVPRAGATGPLRSIYLRDPDLNLVEISEAV